MDEQQLCAAGPAGSLENKIAGAEWRVCEWYDYWKGRVYVSFSGGRDSTVLLHIARGLYPDVPAVFCNTGLEFPEIREFVRQTENVTWLHPRMKFAQVIRVEGYPLVSKEQASYLDEVRTARARGTKHWERQRLHGIRPDGRIWGSGQSCATST